MAEEKQQPSETRNTCFAAALSALDLSSILILGHSLPADIHTRYALQPAPHLHLVAPQWKARWKRVMAQRQER